MFVGGIDSNIKNIIWNNKELFRNKIILDICVGNFNLETLLCKIPKYYITLDTSLFSQILASYFFNKPYDYIKIKDNLFKNEIEYLPALMVHLTTISKYALKKNKHQKRMFNIKVEEYFKNKKKYNVKY